VTKALVARKYARALFGAGIQHDVLDALYDEAESLLAYLRQERRLLAFLTAPQILDADKERVVRNTFGEHVSSTFLSFLLLLVNRHRIDHLDAVLDIFIGLVKEHRGIVATQVWTAFPLSGEERDRIAAEVARRLNKQVELTVVEDPGLIGGIVVRIGNKVLDYSLQHFLRQLRDQLMARSL
jgi:F-type H+-transporting ATPase subunit delta